MNFDEGKWANADSTMLARSMVKVFLNEGMDVVLQGENGNMGYHWHINWKGNLHQGQIIQILNTILRPYQYKKFHYRFPLNREISIQFNPRYTTDRIHIIDCGEIPGGIYSLRDLLVNAGYTVGMIKAMKRNEVRFQLMRGEKHDKQTDQEAQSGEI